MLLTDGLPNINPPRGVIPMLQRYKEQNGLHCSINTFGFGYNLDSTMLRDIALEGDGMYAFIPDATFVGTAFVNATSNVLATMAKNVELTLSCVGGGSWAPGEVGPMVGCLPSSIEDEAIKVRLGSLQYGQSKHVVAFTNTPADQISATLSYQTRHSEEALSLNVVGGSEAVPEVARQRLRLEATACLPMLVELATAEDLEQAQVMLKTLIERIKANPQKDPKLLQDLTGQVSEAISRKDWYQRWGGHYLPSLQCAHQMEQCNNFKDPGVQGYGGKVFEAIRDIADDTFMKLPPPEPSIVNRQRMAPIPAHLAPGGAGIMASSMSRPGPAAAPINMAAYNNASAPCFHGASLITLADGSSKPVGEVVKGDRVRSASGSTATVLCVVKTLSEQGLHALVELQGLRITPYHPVRVQGQWQFPCSLAAASTVPCEAVFSLVVDRHHTVEIGGVECVTLGHDFEEEVVRHPYFGSQRVVQDLQQLPGWQEGQLIFKPNCMKRDSSGLQCSFDAGKLTSAQGQQGQCA